MEGIVSSRSRGKQIGNGCGCGGSPLSEVFAAALMWFGPPSFKICFSQACLTLMILLISSLSSLILASSREEFWISMTFPPISLRIWERHLSHSFRSLHSLAIRGRRLGFSPRPASPLWAATHRFSMPAAFSSLLAIFPQAFSSVRKSARCARSSRVSRRRVAGDETCLSLLSPSLSRGRERVYLQVSLPRAAAQADLQVLRLRLQRR